MSGYPHGPSGYGYGYGAPPAQPYAAPSPYGAPQQGHGQAPPQQGHGQGPPQQGHGQPYAPPQSGAYGAPSAPYGASSAPYGAPSAPYGAASAPYKPPKDKPQQPHAIPSGGPPTAPPYGSPFASLLPSSFPPGTDPSVVACFQVADSDGSGFIDDKELQRALSSYNQSFSMRTVHLLMYLFTNTNTRKIG